MIDFQLLGDASDVEVLVEAVKIALRIAENTNAFQKLGATYPPIPHPECLNHFYRSDPYWRCFIDQTAGNWLHLCGTNSMGKVDDPMAVLDSKLKVIGMQGLRVIDASSMPVVPNTNTNAPTMMVAEKGADEILKEHMGLV
jgi:choline dehydrogenase-like flavoprotein